MKSNIFATFGLIPLGWFGARLLFDRPPFQLYPQDMLVIPICFAMFYFYQWIDQKRKG